MKSIEERAKEWGEHIVETTPYDVVNDKLCVFDEDRDIADVAEESYIKGATDQKAIDEKVRLKKSDDMTKAEYDRETAFADWYLKNGKGTPTYSDAIEWARKDLLDKVCEWIDEFLHSFLMKNHISYKEVEQEFRKLAMKWLRNFFKKEKMLRDKVVEMYGEEAGVYYDKTCQGIPIGGFLKTVMFVRMVEKARELLEMEK